LKQDGVGLADVLGELKAMSAYRRERSGSTLVGGVFGRGIREYVRRDFHPMQNPVDDLATEFFARSPLPS
jgi:hypothetical protein